MIIRIMLEEVEKIGGPIGEATYLNGRHTIIEGDYSPATEMDGLLRSIECQLDEWEEEAAKEIILEETRDKLVRFVSRVIEGERSYLTDRESVVYDPEDESASWRIRKDDGRHAIVTIRLTSED